jgi:hypothetical protein
VVSSELASRRRSKVLTRVVPANRRLHDLLHPGSNGDLLGGTEEVSSLMVVDDLEAELADMDVGVRDDSVASEVDEALGLLLLDEADSEEGQLGSAQERKGKDVRPRPLASRGEYP